MGAKAHASPIRRLARVGERVAVLDQRHGEFMCQMGMTAAMTAALGEAEMGFLAGVVHALGRVPGKAPGEALREIGALDRLGYLGLRQFRRMDNERRMLDQRPLDRLQGAVNIEAFPILPRHVE